MSSIKARASFKALLILSAMLAAGPLLLLDKCQGYIRFHEPPAEPAVHSTEPSLKPLHGAAAAPQSCGSCIKPEWRQHFIFANSTGGHLDACPDSSSWPPGLWTGPEDGSSVGSTTATPSWSSPTQYQRPAEPGEAAVLPATLMAQQAIWRQQHPADCSTAKFVVYESMPSGIGSMLHAQGAAMSAALETGRVFIEAPGNDLTDTPYCGSHHTLDSCYFLPLSNCSLQQAGVTAQDLRTAPALSMHELKRYAASEPDAPRVVVMGQEQAAAVRTLTPSIFGAALDAAGLPASRRYWWWRAQAVAFIVRPNMRTRLEITRRKRQKLRGSKLQAGCVSVFVRHGDKSAESKVWDDAAYEAAANQLRAIDTSLTNQLFVATDDHATAAYFNSTARNWRTSSLDMKLKPDPTKPLSLWPDAQLLDMEGTSEEMLDCLVSLDLSLSCDGFVASFYSNWARLIEELRATVRCKAHRVFLDVAPELMQDRSVGGLDLNW